MNEPRDRRAALVTGGSRGIGAAIVRRLAADGVDVAFTCRSMPNDAADALTAQLRSTDSDVVAIAADSADAGEVVGAVELAAGRFGRLDILVNNAGVFPSGPLGDVTVEEVDHALAVHCRAAFLASQAAARHMTAGGLVLTIGSSLAERVPSPGLSLYAMTKSALVGMTRGLARDLGERGISAVLVHPGSIDTDMNPADGPDAAAEIGRIAFGRYGTPMEVAAVVAALAGDAGRYVTGSSIAVDGGFAA